MLSERMKQAKPLTWDDIINAVKCYDEVKSEDICRRVAQHNKGCDRLDPNTEADQIGQLHTGTQSVESKKMPSKKQKHVYEEIPSQGGEDKGIKTPIAISETGSNSSSNDRDMPKRKKAHSFSSTLSHDVAQKDKRSLTKSLSSDTNTSRIDPDAETHLYIECSKTDELKKLYKAKQTEDSPDDQTHMTSTIKATDSKSTTTSDTPSKAKHTQASPISDDEIHFFYRHTLECDDTGLEHTINGHNITIRIPEGAIAAGEKLCLKVGVTMFGPFTFPENSWPISPILQLCPSEIEYKFRKPFTIILPHFLSKETIEKLNLGDVCFAKAKHYSTGQERRESYQFELVDIRPMFASSGSRDFGVLEIQHCCYLCLLKHKNLEGAEYCLVQIERPLQPKCEVHFLVSYFLDTCLQAIEEQYPPEENNNIRRYNIRLFQFSFQYLEMHVLTQLKEYEIGFQPSPPRVHSLSIHNTCMFLRQKKHEHYTQDYISRGDFENSCPPSPLGIGLPHLYCEDAPPPQDLFNSPLWIFAIDVWPLQSKILK